MWWKYSLTSELFSEVLGLLQKTLSLSVKLDYKVLCDTGKLFCFIYFPSKHSHPEYSTTEHKTLKLERLISEEANATVTEFVTLMVVLRNNYIGNQHLRSVSRRFFTYLIYLIKILWRSSNCCHPISCHQLGHEQIISPPTNWTLPAKFYKLNWSCW